MASLDDDSLFTDNPMDDSIDIWINKLETLNHGMSKFEFYQIRLPRKHFLHLTTGFTFK